ncbi:MAG: tetratricopeptide repeat protein [Kofleriaceae bacterium]
MKSQLSRILFAVVLMAGACGGGDNVAPPKQQAKIAVVPQAQPDPAPVAPRGKVDVLAVTAVPGTFGECITVGKELAAKGENVEARELFEAARALDPKHALPHVELARSYIGTKDKALARKHARMGVKLAPSSSYAFNTLGRAELLRHDYDAAITAFATATEIDDTNVWAWNNLGLVYLMLDQHEDAVAALEQATTHKGATGFMWNNLGLAYEQLDQLDDARVAFERGGKLGSSEAVASRKRLEGVKSIIVMKSDPKPAAVKTFEPREPAPDPDDVDVDTAADEPDELN